MAFFAELRRRRVGKVAVAYGAIAWAVTEGGSVVAPALHLPEWTMTFIVVLFMAGFPVAMALAWIFDLGPEGIHRTEQLPVATPGSSVRLRAAYAAVVVLLMAALGYLLYERGLGRAQAGAPRTSIAVLPFTNLSGDPSKEYFSDGMSEELLDLLARVPGLQVASRTSAFAYKGRGVDIRQVGKELGVESVLEGSVRQAGDRVRITAQLIDTQSGFHLWSETYDRQLEDIFAVQDEIAQAIVSNLRIQLAPGEQKLAAREKVPTQNLEAYQLYLQGRAVWKRRGADNLRRAIDLYQAALGRDPGFARAHAALASAYVVLPGYTRQEGDEQKFYQLAEVSARQALAVDPNIGEAHAVLAQISAGRGDLLDAESGFFFAISLEPNEATPHQWYSLLLQKVGRLGAALTQARRAQELDPGSAIIAANLAEVYLASGNDDQALHFAKLAEQLGLGEHHHGVEASVALRRGQWPQAKRLLDEEPDLPPPVRARIGLFVDAVADPAARPAAVAALRSLDPKVIRQTDLLEPYLRLGQVDLVYQLLLDSLDRDHLAWVRSWDLSHAWSPEGRPLRADARFAQLTERIGMIDYWKQYGFPDGCRPDAHAPIVCP
ncbi:MAG TPA: hypothetical protein VMT50_11905 [Steroidobacteraceae bacterium]|nr:hypothetical protein [Steroidobacteraceae bacterium]